MAAFLSDHLSNVISQLTTFRNTVDSDKRRNLLTALRQAQQEAKEKGITIAPDASPEVVAAKIGQLQAGDAVAEAMGIREIAGTGDYEYFDRHWIESALNYQHTGKNRVIFPTAAEKKVNPVKQLVNKKEIRIAIAGDWGTGTDPGDKYPYAVAGKVAKLMAAQQPDYTIHLGDVYYSGLESEETAKFVGRWPRGAVGSYTLNSNHEMYCGGKGYFNVLLANEMFAAQQGLSYFALTNDHWLIVGLDSAYFAYYQSLLYEQGALFEPDEQKQPDGMVQSEWLTGLLKDQADKRVIILTHHDGFDVHPVTGKLTRKPLYQQMTAQMANVHDWWWYWGHVHGVIAYERIFFDNNAAVTPRCIGHGAIPYLPFPPDLSHLGDGTVRVQWVETDLARSGGDSRRAPNGYLLLTIAGAELREQLFDELGRARWSNF
jgi:Calcineurin-like phosphoesterase